MHYAGFLIRKERLKRSWSQEGLCSGICTVSYLSKIEQGKAEASREITELLLGRMSVAWDADSRLGELVEKAYEALLSCDGSGLEKITDGSEWKRLENGPYAPDKLLLDMFASDAEWNADDALEVCMDNRQLALMRCLQSRDDDALKLYPCAFLYYAAGERRYRRGENAAALEMLQMAYQLAAQEGRARVMMYARLIMGNCYSNRRDIAAMEAHYRVAGRLAKAMGESRDLEIIRYNSASTYLEAGDYRRALEYFEKVKRHTSMTLHKLAICHEKLGQTDKALDEIARAEAMAGEEDGVIDEEVIRIMCRVVRLRLTVPEYVRDEEYGRALLECFEKCRRELPAGYAAFHLPWVLEWYEENRLYKQAYALLRDFPEELKKT